MAVGDKVQGFAAITSFSTFDVKPSTAGTQWSVHNLYHSRSAALEVATNTGVIRVDEHSGEGAWLGYWFNVTSTQWIRLVNLTSTKNNVAFDGVQTR